jgi:hypothetical protein
MLRRRPVNERAVCRQIQRDGVGVENDPQAPFAAKIAPNVPGQGAHKSRACQHQEAERPLHGEGERGKAKHKAGHGGEENDAEKRQQTRRQRQPENAPGSRGGALRGGVQGLGDRGHRRLIVPR